MKNISSLLLFFLFSVSAFAANISDNSLTAKRDEANSAPSIEYNHNPTNVLRPFGIRVSIGLGSIKMGSSSTADFRGSDGLSNLTLESTIDGYTFSNNSITAISPDGISIAGGAIFIDPKIGSDVNISNSFFTSNIINTDAAASVGGAIASFLEGNTLNISDSEFNGNIVMHGSSKKTSVANAGAEGYIAAGGAIFTMTNVNVDNSTFSNNSVSADGYMARGGAIANYGGTVTVEDSSFYNNSVVSRQNEAIGGAISNTQKDDTGSGGTLTIVAKNKDVVFSGNTMNGTPNDIYNKGGSVTNLNAATGKSITFNGGIDGDAANFSNNKVIINQSNSSGVAGGTIVLNADIKNNTVEMYGGTLNFASTTITDYFNNAPLNIKGDSTFSLQNGAIRNVNLGNFNINNGGVSLLLDVNLDNLTVDSISANTSLADNKFTISGFNVLADTMLDRVTINLDDIFSGATASDALASAYASGFPTTADGAIYTYDVELDDTNYTVDFVRRGDYVSGFSPYLYNQTISMRQIANVQHYITQNILNKDNFMFDVDFKKLILSDRIKYRSKIIAIKDKNTSKVINKRIFNLVRVDSREDALRLASGEDVYGVLAMRQDLSITAKNQRRPNVWINAMGLKDTAKYDDFSSVKNDFFTILLGVNTKTKEFGNGVKAYGNVYLGYLRGNQKYDDNKIENDGGYVGASGFIERNNIFMALTANIGFLSNDAKNKYGKDDYDNYWIALSTKFGYNYNIGNSGYSLEPSVYLSYVFVNADSYNSRSGVRINQENLNSFQVAPSLKLSKIFKKDLSLSIKAKYVVELVNDLDVKANNILLPELTDDPFIEYGISLDKKIKDIFSLNVELNRRDGGRHGWIGGVNAKFFF